jgi:hypothetical protein
MGLDQDKVSQYIKDQANKDAAAHEASIKAYDPDKRILSPAEVSAIPSDLKKSYPNLTEGQIEVLTKRLGKTPNQGDLQKTLDKASDMRKDNINEQLAQQKENTKAANNTDDILTTPDALGYTPHNYGGSLKEYNKRQSAMKKNIDNTAKMEGTYQQFQSILNDVAAGKDLTGAQSVVALFNAIGISAEPLAGKGFRINNNTVEEHANALSLPDRLVRGAVALFKNGETITPQQIKDYANIAMETRKNAYVNLVNEAHGQGLNADFILPTGNGRKMDAQTAKIFLQLTGGNLDAAMKAATAKGWQ